MNGVCDEFRSRARNVAGDTLEAILEAPHRIRRLSRERNTLNEETGIAANCEVRMVKRTFARYQRTYSWNHSGSTAVGFGFVCRSILTAAFGVTFHWTRD
jgi:hypothetical protein